MRILSTAAAAVAFVAAYAGSEAQAARWCAYDGDAALRCGFRSQQQCKRVAGSRSDCRPQVAYRQAPPRNGLAPGQIYPSRPAWASPYECFIDEGYGRFRPCNAGGDGGGGLN
jgi:hypothetical protein